MSPVGSEGTVRWAFAWAQVLRDTPDGRISAAVHRQATLTDQEVHDLLLGRSRLDEFINYAYRAQKSYRDGRAEAGRLDAAEGIASFLDVIFAVAGRVRPYNKYLAWELSEHPLPGDRYRAEELLGLIQALLAGEPSAMTAAFEMVEHAARVHDERVGGSELSDLISGWGPAELQLLRGAGSTSTQGRGPEI